LLKDQEKKESFCRAPPGMTDLFTWSIKKIAFGLMASTYLILLIVPSLYSVLDDLGLAKHSERKINNEV